MARLGMGMLCLAALIAYVQRSAISVPSKVIQQDLGLDDTSLGWVMAAWYWGYALLQIPSGWVADTLGSKRALVLFAISWSLFTGLVSLAGNFGQLLFFWGIMGVAQAGIFPASAKAIGIWFPIQGKAFASGLLASSMAVGAALAPAITAQLLLGFTWKQILILYAIPGIVWAVLFHLTIPNPQPAQSQLGPPPAKKEIWSRIFGSVSMWLLCAQQFLRASAMVFFGTWFPRFLEETRGLTTLEAGRMTAWPGIGVMLGGLLGGTVSDYILRRTKSPRLSRQGVAVVGMTTCALLFVTAHFVSDVRISVLLISLGAFWGSFGGVSGYSVAIDFGGRHTATVFSTMNMCGNIGAGLFPLAVGALVQRSGTWHFVLFLFAGLFALDAIIWSFLNPKGPLFETESHEQNH